MAVEQRERPRAGAGPDRSDQPALLVAATRSFLADNGTMLASALAYASFFAIPSVLLVAVGLFSLTTGPGTIATLTGHLGTVIPGQAAQLVGSSLRRLDANPASGVATTAVGLVLALWSTTGAMTTYMTAVNLAWDRTDRRSFVRKRLVALAMAAVIGAAFLLVAVLLIFGPEAEHLVATHVGAGGAVVAWIWWAAQWPILVAGLLVAFATVLHHGPDREGERRRIVTPGAVLAVAVWLVASGAFAVYTSRFGSYNKAWGALASVIVMLTWLWLAGIALLLGAETDAEAARRRRA